VIKSAPCIIVAIETGDPKALLKCATKEKVRLESLLLSKSGGEHDILLANRLIDMLVRQVLAQTGPGIGSHVVPRLDD
jgi:hypothetical protein